MKIKYTQIVGVESDENQVIIKFRPQGSDSADKPLTVSVTPHDTYIHVNVCLSGKNITNVVHGANIVNFKYQ